MPRYRVAPHETQEPFSEGGQGEGPELESITTTFSDDGKEVFFCSGYSAREIATRHLKDSGGKIYVNAVSRKIIRGDFANASNAPVYYGVSAAPVYTLIRQDGKVVRAYWPELDA